MKTALCFLSFFFVGLLGSFAQFAGGDGTESNPYQISTHEHLNNVRNYLDNPDVHFVLINDIDLTDECASGGDYYNYGQGWIPIGDVDGCFKGYFDGDNYTISGLFIDRPANLQGLFADLHEAVIIDLNLFNVNISGTHRIGSIAGEAINSTFSNCHATTNVIASFGSNGGIVGYTSNSVFCNCSSEGTLYSSSVQNAGLIGNARYSLIIKCYSTVDLQSSSSSNGGLVGSAENCNIVNCYSRGEVVSDGSTLSIAGFAGVNEYGKIINCYSTGRVFFENDNITNVGFLGSFLTGSNFLMSGNYFDMETSEQNSSVGAMERTTEEMTFPYAENTYVDYDFENVWLADSNFNINDGYPYLSDELSMSVTEWPIALSVNCGESLNDSELSGGESLVDGVFVFDTVNIVFNNPGIYQIPVVYLPSNDYCFQPENSLVEIQVIGTPPEVTEWPMSDTIFCGDELSSATLTGGVANVEGEFTFLYPDSVPDISGNCLSQIVFTPNEGTCYDTLSSQIDVFVDMTDPIITDWPLASSVYCGESLESSNLTGGLASVPGTFVFQDAEFIPEDAGEISASVLFIPDNDACYNSLLGSVNLNVNYSAPSVFQWPTADTLLYGDSIGMSSLTGGNADVDGIFEFVNTSIVPDNAGVFMAEVVFIPTDDNCYTSLTGTIEVYIEKAVAEIVISDSNHNYDQTEKSVTVTTNPVGLNVSVTYDGNSELPIEVGSYFVEAEIVEQNYVGYASDSMKIHPPVLNITAISFNKYYGDEYVFSGNEYVVTGLFGTDYVESVDLSSAGVSESAALGDYPIVVSNAVGQGLENYNINYFEGVLTVTDKTILALNNLEIYDKVYDATNEAQIMTFGSLSGIEAGDEIFLDTTNYVALFNDKNIGNNKPVYITGLSLTGADADGYVVNSQIGFAAIFPRELNVISALAHDKVYDGTTHCIITNAELEGVINNENVLLGNVAQGNFVQDNVGIDIPVVVLMTLEGDDAYNYTLTQPDYLLADITPKEVFIAGDFIVADKVYDETTVASLENSNLYPEIIIADDEVSICNLDIEFANAGPGDSIPVHIVSASLCGYDALNYFLNTANAPISYANISPKQYSLTIDVNGNGDVFVNDTLYSAPLLFVEGTDVEIEADAYEYYRFDKWTNDLFSYLRIESVMMDSNIYIVCEFVPSEYSPFHLYPNPFYDEVFITKPEMVDRVKVYSTLGQYIGEQTFDGESFKFSTLGLGMYVLKVIDTHGEIHVFKLVKAIKD